jgi:hypothetical protein
MKHRPKHIIEYVLLRGLLGLVNVLPLRVALAVGWLHEPPRRRFSGKRG